jgi:hypothetical protein
LDNFQLFVSGGACFFTFYPFLAGQQSQLETAPLRASVESPIFRESSVGILTLSLAFLADVVVDFSTHALSRHAYKHYTKYTDMLVDVELALFIGGVSVVPLVALLPSTQVTSAARNFWPQNFHLTIPVLFFFLVAAIGTGVHVRILRPKGPAGGLRGSAGLPHVPPTVPHGRDAPVQRRLRRRYRVHALCVELFLGPGEFFYCLFGRSLCLEYMHRIYTVDPSLFITSSFSPVDGFTHVEVCVFSGKCRRCLVRVVLRQLAGHLRRAARVAAAASPRPSRRGGEQVRHGDRHQTHGRDVTDADPHSSS